MMMMMMMMMMNIENKAYIHLLADDVSKASLSTDDVYQVPKYFFHFYQIAHAHI